MSSVNARHVLLTLLPLLACQPDSGDSTGDGGSSTGGAAELDVRVDIPPADPRYFDIVTPEAVVPAGEERLFCYHLPYKGEQMLVHNLIATQGKYGHHAFVMATDKPLPEGTMEDCTAVKDMLKYRPLILPLELPDGAGAVIEPGTNIVAQSHYVNASDQPLRIRDVLRVEKMDSADLSTKAAMFTTNTIKFTLPPGETEVTFDCTVPNDTELMLVGGHMHEQGTRLEVWHGPTVDSLERVYLADPWRVEYRDNPPITKLFDTPRPLKAGDTVRVTCAWNNETGEDMKFPGEMCGSFGLFRGTWDIWSCLIQ